MTVGDSQVIVIVLEGPPEDAGNRLKERRFGWVSKDRIIEDVAEAWQLTTRRYIWGYKGRGRAPL